MRIFFFLPPFSYWPPSFSGTITTDNQKVRISINIYPAQLNLFIFKSQIVKLDFRCADNAKSMYKKKIEKPVGEKLHR